jgi:RimJ/RimL family protein N-acetyltransferase
MGFFEKACQKLFGHPHECPPDCQSCNDFIRRLVDTSPETIESRFGYCGIPEDPFAPIRTCVKTRDEIVVAVCDARIRNNGAEIGIIRDPNIPLIGAADRAFSLMTQKLKALDVQEVHGVVNEKNSASQNFLARNQFYPDIDEIDGTRGDTTWRREL